MNETTFKGFVMGVAAGAGLMYLLDPERGRRRRARMRDQAISAWSNLDDAMGTTARDLQHRAQGLVAEARSTFERDDAPDQVLEARVRSEIGRVVSHPRAIDVRADQGRVTLSGPVLARDVDNLLACVRKVHGVKEVENRLDVHQRADDVPGLQGQARPPAPQFELMQTNWSPAARLLTGIAGGGLAFLSFGAPLPVNIALGAAGVTLLARALTNKELKRLIGLGGGRRAVDIRKTINVNAPVDEVFAFWRNWENFPRFMRNVREVRDLGNGRSHWIIAGPAGISVEWDAEITRLIPNDVIAWKSVPGSVIANAGIVQFQPNRDGGTRVDIRLSYNPPAGALGHLVATIFGANPKREMDEDLVRFKSLIETGKATADGETVTRDEFVGMALERGA